MKGSEVGQVHKCSRVHFQCFMIYSEDVRKEEDWPDQKVDSFDDGGQCWVLGCE